MMVMHDHMMIDEPIRCGVGNRWNRHRWFGMLGYLESLVVVMMVRCGIGDYYYYYGWMWYDVGLPWGYYP